MEINQILDIASQALMAATIGVVTYMIVKIVFNHYRYMVAKQFAKEIANRCNR